MTYHAAFSAEDCSEIINELKSLEGPLLPILHALQERYGHVDEAMVRLISAGLNLSRAEVYGVLSFYHDYRQEPHGRHVLKVCRAEACQSKGSDALAASIEAALGIKFGETTGDRQVTLEAVYCLGLCATAPSAMLDGRLIGRLSQKKVDAIVDEVRL
ncbi:MAG: formate dehydrogenase subunit gamma [Hyphomicrobiales bacterium]|nr:MAG: formate dehydrogenase subunit gamma [Hyphomicrobiales bacterium]